MNLSEIDWYDVLGHQRPEAFRRTDLYRRECLGLPIAAQDVADVIDELVDLECNHDDAHFECADLSDYNGIEDRVEEVEDALRDLRDHLKEILERDANEAGYGHLEVRRDIASAVAEIERRWYL